MHHVINPIICSNIFQILEEDGLAGSFLFVDSMNRQKLTEFCGYINRRGGAGRRCGAEMLRAEELTCITYHLILKRLVQVISAPSHFGTKPLGPQYFSAPVNFALKHFYQDISSPNH